MLNLAGPCSKASMRRAQKGLSLIEMMVGIAIGLFIVAGATVLAGTQLGENRRLISETQLQQDMRAALDIITREIRRTGSSPDPEHQMWSPAIPLRDPVANVFITTALEFDVGGDAVRYKYYRYGLPVQTYHYLLSDGKIRQTVVSPTGTTTTQDVTDRNTMLVEALTVTPSFGPDIQIPCPRLCAGNTQSCWPTSRVIEAVVSITAIPGHETTANATIRRTMTSRVRIRNDAVTFNAAGKVCPA